MYEFVDYLCMLDKSTPGAARSEPVESGAEAVVEPEPSEDAKGCSDLTMPLAERCA